jgi:hypothetical protein
MGRDRDTRPAFVYFSSSDLFTPPNCLQEGFCNRPNVLSGDEDDGLTGELADLYSSRSTFRGSWPTPRSELRLPLLLRPLRCR